MAAFFNFVLLGIHAPDGHGMPHTQNFGQARMAEKLSRVEPK
jgi:hypothetical protein